MPLVADRVFETTTVQGAGALSLAGAQSGFRAFQDAFDDGAEVFYLIEQADTAWEVGRGVFTRGTPDTLSRVQVLSSSAAGGAINFGPGIKNVLAVTPGAEINQLLNNSPRLDRVNGYRARQVIFGIGDATLSIVGDSFVSPSLESYRDSAGDHGMWLFKSARGPRAAPADLNDGDRILSLSPRPRIGGIFSHIAAVWAILRDAKSAVEWRFFNGGLSVGSPAGGYKGPGTGNFQEIYDDNVQLHALRAGVRAEQATTSGTAVDFTGIRADAQRITVTFDRVGLSNADNWIVQLGTASGLEGAGYEASSSGRSIGVISSSGFVVFSASSVTRLSGHMVLTRSPGNKWVASHALGRLDSDDQISGGGSKVLGGTTTRLRVRPSGSGTLSSGAVGLQVE